MIRLGEIVMILDLHRQGAGVSAIARRTGLDRKTVRKVIAGGLEPPIEDHHNLSQSGHPLPSIPEREASATVS